MADENTVSEDLDSFRQRAREWLAANMSRVGPDGQPAGYSDASVARARILQGKLFEGGFAGLCFPREHGGQGLSPAHQRVFNEECAAYEMPAVLNICHLTILAPTLLDFGTEEQKQRYLPAILRGEELWIQFLSEPTGGSDLAGVITRATPDADGWLLSGSKIWSTGADVSDYALCLARTDWDAPKHRGLTMFVVKIHQPGITVERIKQVNGSMEFCQEFFDDVRIPPENVVGQVNDGWSVASRLLLHERNSIGGATSFASGPRRGRSSDGAQRDLVELAKGTGQADDQGVRQLVAEAHVLGAVQGHLLQRVGAGMGTGHFPGTAGAILKLYGATTGIRCSDIGLEIAGTAGVAWNEDRRMAGQYGQQYLSKQSGGLAGGSNEMQRNIISERVLGMPREFAADRDRPFGEVKHNRMPVRAVER